MLFLLVLPSHVIGIDDGTTLTYHKTINATCVEKKLADKFGGWEIDLPKPIEELEVYCISLLYFLFCIYMHLLAPSCLSGASLSKALNLQYFSLRSV